MQDQLLKAFSQNIIAIDFEFRDGDHPPYKVGVYSPDTGNSQEWYIDKKSEAKVMELVDKICSHKDIILGHNIIDHDLALLQKFYPHLNLLNKPVIDTLLLSPLAFPKWPYHKLIKDYKLVSYSRNKPADDARLSWSLFEDEVSNLSNRDKVPDLIFSAYANWFIAADTKGGFQRFYEALADDRNFRVDVSEELMPVLSQLLKDRACSTNFERAFTDNAKNPLAKAFSLSWIYGADEFSILSRWVRLQYSDVEVILNELRDEDCGSHDCVYCRSTFDLNSHLKNFFDFDHLRPDQESIVQRMIDEENLLAILPTGGGKSLCYQLPALIHALRRKKLTVVISPLQALMKDQVDNLKAKQIRNAGAVFSGITPQERKEVLDGVETGKIDIIYIAPEQLRNSNFISRIKQREIGTWVIDEAHCVSKWGHDFRPDYLYIPKIIARLSDENNVPIPQVACFTATAKKDVIDEIQDIFIKRLGVKLEDVNKFKKRDELTYATASVEENQKLDRLIELLASEKGDAIVYVATRNGAKKVTESLNNASELLEQGRKARYFHSKVEPEEKKSVQNWFTDKTNKEPKVIVATNAFGMGVDKPNVRLVVHFDIPGSLENYLQEAGRAGRDQDPARCVLLYSPGDIEKQLQMKTMNRITKRDASEILKGIYKIDKKTQFTRDVTVTAGEILMEEGVETNFEIGDYDTETKVKTALAVLEDSGILAREENYYTVFEVTNISLSLEEVTERLKEWDLPDKKHDIYEMVYLHLLNSDEDEVINIDKISHSTGLGIKAVIRILHDLNDHGVIKITTNLVVYLNKGVRGDAKTNLEKLLERQQKLFDLMVENSEQWDEDATLRFNVREATSEMQTEWSDVTPPQVIQLFENFRRLNLIDRRRIRKDLFTVKIKTSLEKAMLTLKQASELCTLLISYINAVIDLTPQVESADTEKHEEELLPGSRGNVTGSHLRAEFTAEKLDDYLKRFYPDKSREERTELTNQALLFLNENEILRIGRGLAVLKTAMRIILPDEKKRRSIQFDRLLEYYKEQIFQVHVIEEYAERSLREIVEALEFVADYFKLDRNEFRHKYFPDREDDELERPTSKADYQKIVLELNNPVQQEIVEAKDENLLVVAGPGSGKTRAIVHRAAYLLKVERIKPSSILIVAFNREAVNEVKNRLRKLVGGRLAAHVDIYTYHGIAMRLAGKTYSPQTRVSQSEDYFDELLKESVRILEQSEDEDLEEWEDRRSKLLRGYTHILVDEYQDIDDDCYKLISAIAGRTASDESKLQIIAVGDDDQNIYSWKGSKNEYIRRFQDDYEARTIFLVENYRSTKTIIGASNKLIAANKDRIKSKGKNEVEINLARVKQPAGGVWESIDASGDKGKVLILETNYRKDQGGVILSEILRRKQLQSDMRYSDIAILTRTNDDADLISESFKQLNPPIPTRSPSPTSIPFPMYREVADILEDLDRNRDDIQFAKDIAKVVGNKLKAEAKSVWQYRVLIGLLRDFVSFNGRTVITLDDWNQYLWDYAATQKGQIPDLNAILVTTIHQAKGKEFKHVFLLDPGNVGQNNKPGQSIEDERRLYYVGLTRAMELATVIEVADSKAPFADEISAANDFVVCRDGIIQKKWSETTSRLPERLKVKQMGLSDIWASSFARDNTKWFQRDKVQSLLKDITIGAPLKFQCSDFTPGNGVVCAVEIHHNGLKLGSLSQATARSFQEPDGIKVEVGAVIQCWKDEEDKYATLDKYYAVLPRVILT